MARSGVLPAALAKLHPTHKTPVNAILVLLAVSIVTFVIAAIFGPADTFTVYSLMSTFGLIIIYCMLNLGVVRYYALGAGRPEFNWLLHGVFPVLSSAAVLWVGYKSVVPLPAAPAKYAPLVTAGCVIAGLLVLAWLHLSGKEQWLAKAGEAMDETEDPVPQLGVPATASELVG
jgi:amino acid transporter